MVSSFLKVRRKESSYALFIFFLVFFFFFLFLLTNIPSCCCFVVVLQVCCCCFLFFSLQYALVVVLFGPIGWFVAFVGWFLVQLGGARCASSYTSSVVVGRRCVSLVCFLLLLLCCCSLQANNSKTREKGRRHPTPLQARPAAPLVSLLLFQCFRFVHILFCPLLWSMGGSKMGVLLLVLLMLWSALSVVRRQHMRRRSRSTSPLGGVLFNTFL